MQHRGLVYHYTAYIYIYIYILYNIHIYVYICMYNICIFICIYKCHRHGKGIRKRDYEVRTLHNIWDFWHGRRQMHRWNVVVLLCMHSGFPAERLQQMIVMSLYDVMRISHATGGGNYKRRAQPSFRAAVTVIWVFQHKCLGLLTSHTPSTLAVLVPLEWEACPECTVLFVCQYACIQTYLEDFWVIVTSFIWRQPGRPLPPLLEPGIKQSTDHNPSVANCKGGINH